MPVPLATYAPLLRAIRWEQLPRIYDPWALNGSTHEAFATRKLRCLLTDAMPSTVPLHALAGQGSPCTYQQASLLLGSVDALVTVPDTPATDLSIAAATSRGPRTPS